MMQLFIDSGNIPMVVIRFNPDEYINENGIGIQSCFKYHKKWDIPILDTTEWSRRFKKLIKRLKYHIENIPDKEIIVEKMFFDYEKVID